MTLIDGPAGGADHRTARIRTAADFVAAFVNLTGGHDGNASALRGAAHAVRTAGSLELQVLADSMVRDGWERTVDRLSGLATAWGAPVLESLAVALRTDGLVLEPMRAYLVACAQAEACATLPPATPRFDVAAA